jgi:hypothetical protein
MTAILAQAPALPLHTAGPDVAAAYIVFLLIVLSYVGIMARRLTRSSQELRELRARLEARPSDPEAAPAPPAEARPAPPAGGDRAKESEPVG